MALLLILAACHSTKPTRRFEAFPIPSAPDYQKMDYWAAHPNKQDPSDRTPCPNMVNRHADGPVDIFFLHPTTYTGWERYQKNWNGDVLDERLNRKTDSSSILFQASIFNGAGRVFAPRYRQGHLHCFFGKKDTVSAQKALALAYQDVQAAFEYYLAHWNEGRPFIIAGHSQGAFHAMRLIKNTIENTPLQNQLVVAYIVGYPIPDNYFKTLTPCETPDQTGCFCSWRTWKRQYALRKAFEENIVCTNPLNWTVGAGEYAPETANKGAVLRPFCAIYPKATDAEVYKGVLMSRKPKFPGSIFLWKPNYHIGDMNLFYMNIRENAVLRSQAFLRR